ncbi:MAG: hypothetical protein K1V84_12595 [Muribaculaceae bacterium]
MMKNLLKKAIVAATLLLALIPAATMSAADVKLYLVGSFNGWAEKDAAYQLNETAAGSGEFTGKFLMPVNSSNPTQFIKIAKYEGATKTEIGADNSESTVYTVPLVFNAQNIATTPIKADGKTITLTGWTEAKDVTFTVNLKSMTFTAKLDSKVEEITKIYMFGAPSLWKCDDAYVLQRVDDSRKLYEGTLSIPSGFNRFRFYTAFYSTSDEDASKNSLGTNKEVSDVTGLVLQDGVATTPVFSGVGMWDLPTWTGGDLDFKLDLDKLTLTITDPKTSLEVIAVVASPCIAATDGGILVTADKDATIAVYTPSGTLVKMENVEAGDTVITLPAGVYIVNGLKVAVR